MRGIEVCSREALLVEERSKFAGFGERRRLGEYLAMMRAVFAANQGMQGEDAGISRPAEGERRQGVRAPPKAAQNMPGVPLHRLEGGIQRCATHGIVHDVESLTVGVCGYVFFDGDRAIVDGGSAEAFHDAALVR